MTAAESGCPAAALLTGAEPVVEVDEVADAAVDAGSRLMTAWAPSAPPATLPISSNRTAMAVHVRGRLPPCGAAGDACADGAVGGAGGDGSLGPVGPWSRGCAIMVSSCRVQPYA